jgi:hypothetical protein
MAGSSSGRECRCARDADPPPTLSITAAGVPWTANAWHHTGRAAAASQTQQREGVTAHGSPYVDDD